MAAPPAIDEPTPRIREAPALRILLVASKLEAQWTGGIGRVVAGHARALAARGQRVRVSGPADGGSGPLGGVELRPWPSRRRPIARAPWLLRELLSFRPDVVHLHSALPRWPLVATTLAARRASGRPRVVLTPHTGSRADFANAGSRWALHRADAVVTVSRWSADRAIAAGADRERTVVVTPGFRPARTRPRGATGQTIAVLARLAESKGVDVALLAFDRAARSRPGWRLVVGGRGSEAGRLHALADSLDTASRIDLCGWIEGEDKARLLAETAIGLVPSRGDNLPGALLELQAEGIPCIASDTGGMPEAVDHGLAGLLVPPGDVDALATALGRLMDHDDLRLRLGMRAREQARARSWDAATDRLLDVYGRLVGRAAP